MTTSDGPHLAGAVLERFLDGALAPAELVLLRDHYRAGPCPACEDALAEVEDERLDAALDGLVAASLAEAAERLDPERIEAGLACVLAEVRARRARRRVRTAGVLALAAGLVLCAAVAWRLAPRPSPDTGQRYKGAATAAGGVRQLDLLVEQDDRTWKAVGEGAAVRTGDVLLFRVTTTRPVRVGLVQQTGGACQVLLGADAPELPPGTHRLEAGGGPVAVRIDDEPGPSTFRAVPAEVPGRDLCSSAAAATGAARGVLVE